MAAGIRSVVHGLPLVLLLALRYLQARMDRGHWLPTTLGAFATGGAIGCGVGLLTWMLVRPMA